MGLGTTYDLKHIQNIDEREQLSFSLTAVNILNELTVKRAKTNLCFILVGNRPSKYHYLRFKIEAADASHS